MRCLRIARHETHRTGVWGCALVAMLLLSVSARGASALTPKSPEVQALVKRGMEYLETANESRLGGKCLIALALYKGHWALHGPGGAKNYPKIAEAVEACRSAAAGKGTLHGEVYSLGIAVIFLCELDPQKYRGDIEALLHKMQGLQKAHGGWGYPRKGAGDTSMTQYGVLSAWSARNAGVEVPMESVERVTNWLLRTQDPSGCWGYQGRDPGNFTRVRQSKTTLSMTAAGAGSTLMCAHLLKMVKLKEQILDDSLPAVLIPIRDEAEAAAEGPVTDRVDKGRIQQAALLARQWMAANYRIDWKPWTHYYLYALERYMSFRELLEGIDGKNAKWYNDGVAYLKQTQEGDGGWQSAGQHTGKSVDSAFSILFLVRSTKKSIQKAQGYGDGNLSGGRGSLSATSRMRNGRVVNDTYERTGDQMLDALDDADHGALDAAMDNSDALVKSLLSDASGGKSERLRAMISGGEPKARQVAVRALARTRDLDNVPMLIFALTDPDWNVVVEARDGLRFMSRKFEGFGLTDRENNERRIIAIKRWKKWYLTIRPDAIFDN